MFQFVLPLWNVRNKITSIYSIRFLKLRLNTVSYRICEHKSLRCLILVRNWNTRVTIVDYQLQYIHHVLWIAILST